MDKVWICFKSWDYEGCSVPLAAFDSQEKAAKWVKENKNSDYEEAEYEELEVK